MQETGPRSSRSGSTRFTQGRSIAQVAPLAASDLACRRSSSHRCDAPARSLLNPVHPRCCIGLSHRRRTMQHRWPLSRHPCRRHTQAGPTGSPHAWRHSLIPVGTSSLRMSRHVCMHGYIARLLLSSGCSAPPAAAALAPRRCYSRHAQAGEQATCMAAAQGPVPWSLSKRLV